MSIKKRARPGVNEAHLTDRVTPYEVETRSSSGMPKPATPASEAELSLWELSKAIEVGISGLESLAENIEAMQGQRTDKSRVDECRRNLKGICGGLSLSAGRKSAEVIAINTRYFEALRVLELEAAETDRYLGTYVRLHKVLKNTKRGSKEEAIAADDFYAARYELYRNVVSNA
jgi:hypothetical protein